MTETTQDTTLDAMLREISHVEVYAETGIVLIKFFDPVYRWTHVGSESGETFEDAIRKAHAAYQAYVATIPEGMRK